MDATIGRYGMTVTVCCFTARKCSEKLLGAQYLDLFALSLIASLTHFWLLIYTDVLAQGFSTMALVENHCLTAEEDITMLLMTTTFIQIILVAVLKFSDSVVILVPLADIASTSAFGINIVRMNFGQKCALGSLGLNLLTGVFTFMLGGGQLAYFLPAASISVVRTKYPGIDFSPHPLFYPLMFASCFVLNYVALGYLFILEGKQKIFNTFYYVLWAIHALGLIGWVFTYSFEKLFFMFFLICTYGFSSILILIMAMIKSESLSDNSAISTKWFDLLVVNGSACWALYFSSFGCSFFLTTTLMYQDGPSLEVGTLRGFFDKPTTCTLALIPVVVMWSSWILSDLVFFHRYTRHVHVFYPTFLMVCLGVLSNCSSETGLPFNRQIYLFMGVVSLVAFALRGRFYVANKATKKE